MQLELGLDMQIKFMNASDTVRHRIEGFVVKVIVIFQNKKVGCQKVKWTHVIQANTFRLPLTHGRRQKLVPNFRRPSIIAGSISIFRV